MKSPRVWSGQFWFFRDSSGRQPDPVVRRIQRMRADMEPDEILIQHDEPEEYCVSGVELSALPWPDLKPAWDYVPGKRGRPRKAIAGYPDLA